MAHVKVEARRNEPGERLIKRFSRKVKKEGIIDEVRDRRFFVKPSKIRRLKKLRRKRIARKITNDQKTK
jgi:ribosomal protein S21|tara:strand:+ start:287 stop:493 length:207 start_codon:yes stop_codon:yes gene_type:complete